MVAIACYEDRDEGVAIPLLGLVAPALATPVMRGEVRVRPGEPRPAAAPIALRARRGTVDLALGIARAVDAESVLDDLLAGLDQAPTLVSALAARRGGQAVALVRGDDTARVIASA